MVEGKALVDARNQLLLRIRSRLTPFGQLYSEIIKPRASLKSIEKFLAEKGTIEAVLKSVGKTRAVVDKIGVASRVAGPAAIVLEVSLTALVIQHSDPRDRGRIAAREVGGLLGSVGGGLGGMWAGCAGAAMLTSPSLVVPVIGEVTTAGACMVGGMLGGLGIGWLARKAGEAGGEMIYEISNDLGEFYWATRNWDFTMSLISRLNARIGAVLNKRSGAKNLVRAAIVEGQLMLTQADGSMRKIPWSGLKRAAALLRDLYVGTEVSLLLEFSGMQVLEIPESFPDWFDICAAIELLDGAQPFGVWYSQVQRSGAGQMIKIWSAAEFDARDVK